MSRRHLNGFEASILAGAFHRPLFQKKEKFPSPAAALALRAVAEGKDFGEEAAKVVVKQVQKKGTLYCECGRVISANKSQCNKCANPSRIIIP